MLNSFKQFWMFYGFVGWSWWHLGTLKAEVHEFICLIWIFIQMQNEHVVNLCTIEIFIDILHTNRERDSRISLICFRLFLFVFVLGLFACCLKKIICCMWTFVVMNRRLYPVERSQQGSWLKNHCDHWIVVLIRLPECC